MRCYPLVTSTIRCALRSSPDAAVSALDEDRSTTAKPPVADVLELAFDHLPVTLTLIALGLYGCRV